MKSDSTNIRRHALAFPEYGSPTYFKATLGLGMWRRVPVSEYPPARVKALLTEAGRKLKQARVPHELSIHSQHFDYDAHARQNWR